MSDKTLTADELQLTQKIQLHWPRGIDPKVLRTWNGGSKEVLVGALISVFGQLPVLKSTFLYPVPGGQGLVIKTTTGQRTIAKAKDVFPGYIDGDFVNWGLDLIGQATKESLADVWELVKDSTFLQFFQSLGKNLDELCWTQDQIITFCEDHREWLRTDGHVTFFLFKENGEFFVALVNRRGGELKASVRRLSDDGVWSAGDRYRVVIPQLAL